jgi:hypothetical protein
LLKEHRKAHVDALTSMVIHSRTVSEIDTHKIAQIKGQIHTLDRILDIQDFCGEIVNIRPEDRENVQTSRTED